MIISTKRGCFTVPNRKNIINPALLSYPEFKTKDGVRYKRIGFGQTENGFEPIYEETDELSDAEAFQYLFGGEDE